MEQIIIKVFTENVKVTIQDDFALAQNFFKSKNIDIHFTFEEVKTKNRKLRYMQNVNAYQVEGINLELNKKVGDEYAVIYCFNADDFKEITTSAMIGGVRPYVPLISLKTNTQDDSIGWIWKSICHEIMHVLVQKAYFAGFRGVIDYMDKTLVNGQWIPYYKNDDPYAKDGNFALTFKELEPYIKTIDMKKKWNYFTEKEVKGLKNELVDLLDRARKIAGVPFIINSGVRSIEKNQEVGGVDNSSHINGEAVDLTCTTSVNRMKIISALLQVGFKRIGVGKTFIHADISKTLPQEVIWLY